MTPPNTATAHVARATNLYLFEERAEPNAQVSAEPDTVKMGYYYIYNAVPMKGARPANDGRCWFLLKCYQIGDPSKLGANSDRTIDPRQARYIPYYGFLRRKHGEAGLVVGYVYDCIGSKTLGYAEAQSRGLTVPTMTEASHIMVRPPHLPYSPRSRFYGPYSDLIQGTDEHCRTLTEIDRIRDPQPASCRNRCLPI